MSTILAVDDSVINLQMVRNSLSREYKVIAVTDGEKALKYLSANACELILLDYEMPGMDGMSVFRKIREDARLSSVPIIFLTGSSDAATVKQILTLKPDGYIVKPVNPAELIKRVEKILG